MAVAFLPSALRDQWVSCSNFMKTLKRFIIAGHSTQSPGAVSYLGTTEHSYTLELQNLIIANIDKENFVAGQGSSILFDTDDKKNNNRQVINFINSTAKARDFGIDIHFNNNNPAATGTEVIIHPKTNNSNKQRAIYIVNEISRELKIPVRRREPQRDWIYPSETFLGTIGILEQTKIPMVLIEVCFLNNRDLPKYLAKKVEIANIIYKTLFVEIF